MRHLGEGFVWAFPWEHWAWGPAFPWEGEVIWNKTATCSYQTVQAKCFSRNQMAHLSRCRRQWYQECPEGLAWAGWQAHWRIFKLLWFDPCRCKLGLDEAEPDVRFLLIVGAKFDLRSCCCCDRVGQIVTRHVLRIGESRQNPKVCWVVFPRGTKNGSHCKVKDWANWRKCDIHTKENVQEQTGLNCANEQRENWEQRKNVFKVECCGSSLLTSNRKLNLERELLLFDRNRKRKVVANGVYTAKLETEITYEGGRESDWR